MSLISSLTFAACSDVIRSLLFQVVVYAKTWCPHCNKTKELLSKDEFKSVDILIRDVDTIEEPSGPALQMALTKISGQVSIPRVNSRGIHFTNFVIIVDPIVSNQLFSHSFFHQQKSVPNIFIDGKHFGGNSDLQEAYAAGTLKLV